MSEAILFNVFFDVSLIALAVSIAVRKERSLKAAVQSLGFKSMRPAKLFGETARLFAGLIVAAFLLGLAMSAFGVNDGSLVSETLVEESAELFPFFLWLMALAVISEEIFFRGLLIGAFAGFFKGFFRAREQVSRNLGVFASTAVFAVLHAGYGSLLAVAGAFFLGLILAKCFELNRNIYPNIIAHGFYNGFVLAIVFSGV
jgi:hypothetical protein